MSDVIEIPPRVVVRVDDCAPLKEVRIEVLGDDYVNIRVRDPRVQEDGRDLRYGQTFRVPPDSGIELEILDFPGTFAFSGADAVDFGGTLGLRPLRFLENHAGYREAARVAAEMASEGPRD